MVLVRFEYLRTDSERKLLIVQFDICQISGTRKPRHVRKTSSVTDGSRRNVYLLKIEAKSFRDGSQDTCKDTESNLGPFALFFVLNST